MSKSDGEEELEDEQKRRQIACRGQMPQKQSHGRAEATNFLKPLKNK